MKKKKIEPKTWKCPKCGEEVPNNWISKWDHIISKH